MAVTPARSARGSVPVTASEKKAEARRLRAEGMLYQEIADRLGVVKSTALRYCCDTQYNKDRERLRRWKRRNRDRQRQYEREREFRKRNPHAKPGQAKPCACETPMPTTETVELIGTVTTCLKCSREVP